VSGELDFPEIAAPALADIACGERRRTATSHLKLLEAESIFIMREVAAEFRKPVMLYSIGKDSSVLLHLAMKAFHPGKPPFPLLHVDTTWKFREMIAFRDQRVRELGLELMVHVNPDGLASGVGPFSHGSARHTNVMKTQALRQALDLHGFDAAIGGARRDEEKSRAKERIFSYRSAAHRWDPKNQRPELWNLYNTCWHLAKACGFFRCQTGLSSTSGNTSCSRISRSCRFTLPRSGRWSSATAP
jgi:sulfate adenylyltransferase subunit 2